jgi:hypothetical protein
MLAHSGTRLARAAALSRAFTSLPIIDVAALCDSSSVRQRHSTTYHNDRLPLRLAPARSPSLPRAPCPPTERAGQASRGSPAARGLPKRRLLLRPGTRSPRGRHLRRPAGGAQVVCAAGAPPPDPSRPHAALPPSLPCPARPAHAEPACLPTPKDEIKRQIALTPGTSYRGYQALGSNVTRYEGGFARDWHEAIDLYKEVRAGWGVEDCLSCVDGGDGHGGSACVCVWLDGMPASWPA